MNKIVGGKWWKFDFHVHTPGSEDYYMPETTEREFLLAAMQKEIDCLAITDHNDGRWIDKLKQELENMKRESLQEYREIFIFPGVEISVNGNIHVLGIFDCSICSADIYHIMGAVGYDSELHTTTKTINEVVNIITSKGGVAIPAHVDKESGLLKAPVSSIKSCFRTGELLALEVIEYNDITTIQSDNTHIQTYIEQKLELSHIVGSDSHEPESLGRRFTWVKMETPNIDALKLALHDGIEGVRRDTLGSEDPNALNNRSYIGKITITNGFKAGRAKPLEIQFSPWMNTIIGGRGTGKSSILEYARILFDKADELPEQVKNEFFKFNKVYSKKDRLGMLTDNTKIEIEYIKDANNIHLIWEGGEVYQEIEDEQNGISREVAQEVKERFPIRMYSQKQLYQMTNDPQVVIKLIDSQWDKGQWVIREEELVDQYLSSRRNERILRKRSSIKQGIEQRRKDVERKMDLIKTSYDTELINAQKEKVEQENKIKGINNLLSSIVTTLEDAEKDILNKKITVDLIECLDEDAQNKVKIEIEKGEPLKHQLAQIIGAYREISSNIEEIIKKSDWQKEYHSILNKYNEMIKMVQERNVGEVGELQKLQQEIDEIDKQLKDISGAENDLNVQVTISQNLYQDIIYHQQKLRTERLKIVEEWNAQQERLQIMLITMGDQIEAEESFRSIIRKTNETYGQYIAQNDDEGNIQAGIIYELGNVSEDERWEKREEIIKNLVTSSSKPNAIQKHIQSLKENTPEDIDRLTIWIPQDKIKLMLKTGKRLEEIDAGSAGQRTSALLALILSISDSPVIIDQPEDDLDTKNITDLVVEGLIEVKKKQQVIVITHNPNIPVNACSEQIVEMNFAGGNINKAVEGALQDYKIRKSICEVMEGGEKALKNRYFKIFKALSKSSISNR